MTSTSNMRSAVLLLCLLPALCNAAALPALYQGMTLSSQLLNLVKGKYFFLRSSIDQLQMGITNLRNAPIQESDIASLEPQINQLNSRVQYVLANQQLLDQIGISRGTTLIQGLADLRRILPASTSAFNARFNSVGAYGTISQALNKIGEIITTIGARRK